MAAPNIQNVTIGAATLTWGGNTLGHTLGGAKLIFDRKFTELEVDQYGKTPVELALNGQDLMIEVTLAEPIVDYIFNAIPESTELIGSQGREKLGLGKDAGVGLRQFAKQLILHPNAKANTDVSQDVVVYLAVADQKFEMDYVVDKQRTFKVTFRALVDESRGNGFRLGQIGQDPISQSNQ